MQVVKMRSEFRSMALVCTLALGFAGGAARAEYPSQDIISLNISNYSSYRMTGEGATETLAGTLPGNAWQNTSPADRTGVWHSGDALNGYRNGVTAWDGASQSVTNLAGLVFTWAVEGSGTLNYGNLSSRAPAFRQAWLARGSGTGEFTSVVVQNIPYEKYDVIVYVSGNAAATDVRAVLINGVPYKGDSEVENSTRVAAGNESTWGNVGNDTLTLGGNALKVTGLTGPDLQVSMKNATTWGICAIQIVRDMSAGIGNAQRAKGKVISVNIQSAKNTSGYTTGDIGIVRVPAEAWTADGLALANNEANYNSDVNVAIKEWDGAKGTTGELTGITLHEKVKNAYFYGASSYVPQPQVIAGYADDSARPEITVTGVPYKKYDVIVYCATDTENRYFGPVSVNGTPYCWSESDKTTQVASSADSAEGTRWGWSQSRVMAYGGNAIRATDQTSSTLVIVGANNANSCRGGIAGFQIVDTYDPSAVSSVTIEDGGTLELSAAQETALRVICEGSLTIVGANGYTVTNADLLKLDLDGVTGTVTLGANTCYELGANRTLPAGFVFGDGSAVAISESVAEYAKDEFSVSGLTGVSTVVLTRYDGTTETLDVADGAASRGDGTDVKVTGSAAYCYFPFVNSLSSSEGTRRQVTLTSSAESYAEGGGVNATAAPYTGFSSEFGAWSEFSTVVVGTMPSGQKQLFVGFGSTAGGGLLFLASGERVNEVIVGYGTQSSSEILTTMTVPHAAEARHFYTFLISENKSSLTILLDGLKWKTVTRAGGFTLGTSSHSGIQIGSGYGGNPSGYTRAESGVFNALGVYDYVLSDRQIALLKSDYPYASPNGSFSRSVSGETVFETEELTWLKSGDVAPAYRAPADGSEVTLVAADATQVTVNAQLSTENLTFDGEGAVTLKKGEGAVVNNGQTTIGTAVVIEAGSASISGGPTKFVDGGSLVFDYSAFDLFKYSAETLVPLTGELEQQAEGVVTCILPECDATREHTSEFLYTNGCYQLRVIPRAAKDVYLLAGVTEFTDDTEVTWTEGEEATEVTGFAIATDTVHFSAADTVEVNRTLPVAGYDFGEYAGKLVLSSGEAEELILSQTITGAGTVEIASGVVQSRGSFATDINVDSEAMLKLGSVGGFGATDNGVAPSGKTITVAGAVELNGVRDSCNAFTLAGGTLRNTGSEIPTGNRQTTALTLTANSTVHARSDFGLVASQYAATSLNLGGYTLTKTGDASFWLYNTRSEGAGTVDIQAGAIYAHSTVSMPNVNFNVADGATLKIRTDDFTAGSLTGNGVVSVGQNRPTAPLKFMPGTNLSLSIVLASTEEATVSIPCENRPRSVTVYEPSGNWDVESTAATYTYENGYIKVTVDVANRTRANPVTGASQNFDYVFRSTQDPRWELTGNWYSAVGNRWSQYTNSTVSIAPNITGNYSPVLFDGDFIEYAAGQDGYKTVSNTTLTEGWTFRVGLFNGVKVSVDSVKKQQGGCWYMIDETSQLVLGRNTKGGHNGGNVDFYVAAKDGVVFTSDFAFDGCDQVAYYFKGDGSVTYQSGSTKGTHKIMTVILNAGNPQSKLKKLIRRRLVSFGSERNNCAYDLSATAVTSLDTTLRMAKFTPPEETPDAMLTTEADFGTYQLTQTADGVYITYVGYGVPFAIRLR